MKPIPPPATPPATEVRGNGGTIWARLTIVGVGVRVWLTDATRLMVPDMEVRFWLTDATRLMVPGIEVRVWLIHEIG